MEYGGLVEHGRTMHCESLRGSRDRCRVWPQHRPGLRLKEGASSTCGASGSSHQGSSFEVERQKHPKTSKKSLIIFDSSRILKRKTKRFQESSYMFVCSSRFFYIVQGSSCNMPVEFTIVHRFSTEVSWIGTVNLLEVSFAVCGLRVKTCPGSFCAECCQLSQVLESMCVCVFVFVSSHL